MKSEPEHASKVCVVTGATGASGTGRATALHFAGQGWRVVVNYSRDADAASEVAELCLQAGSPRSIAIRADVAKEIDCRNLAAQLHSEFGRCDVLVNNAAVTRFVNHSDLDGLTEDDFDRIFKVNVIGAFLITRALSDLLRRSHGSVVNISSIGAYAGTGSCIAYASSKAALNTLTLSLARVLAPQVRVNALVPGYIDGGWLAGMDEARRESIRASHLARSPLDSYLTPEDVARAVWWLSHGPRNQTGELIRLDSGVHLGRP